MKSFTYYLITITIVCLFFSQCKKEDPFIPDEPVLVIREWTAPVGIPTPDFGIAELYRMYDFEYKRNSDLAYFQNKNGGFYTHFINFETGRDTIVKDEVKILNYYGTIEHPRKTIPANLAPGSVVELHGNKYDSITANYTGAAIIGKGTQSMPIFVRGAKDTRIEFLCKIIIKGSYIITENIKFNSSYNVGIEVWNPSDHISIRNCEMSNYLGLGSCFSLVTKLGSDFENDFNEDIVFYNNHLHDNTDTTSTITVQNGFLIQENSRRVWLVDNLIENGSGDGIKIIFNDKGNYPPNNIYIGRNTIKKPKNNAIEINHCKDVVVSHNVFSGGKYASLFMNAHGAAVPENIFLIFNKFSDSKIGIITEFSSYIYGNIFRDIDSVAISVTNADPVFIANNTFYNTGYGVYNNIGGANIDIINNLISNAKTAHLYYSAGSTLNYAGNLFNNSDGNALIGQIPTINTLSEVSGNFVNSDSCYTDTENNNFTLKSGSLAINNGNENNISDIFYTVFNLDINFDISGIERPSEGKWDIGAYEYVP